MNSLVTLLLVIGVVNAQFSQLGGGVSSGVSSLLWANSKLYVAGRFSAASGISYTSNIASWDPSTSDWATVGGGTASSSNYVYNMALYPSTSPTGFVAVGSFSIIGTKAASGVAYYHFATSSWSAVANTSMATSEQVAVNGTDIWCEKNDDIYRYTTTTGTFTLVGTNTYYTYAMHRSSAGYVYVGGYFTTLGGVAAQSIIRHNGLTWEALGTTGLSSSAYVYTIVSSGSNIYAAGSFSTAGGNAATNIAVWSETTKTWSALALLGSPSSYIYTIALSGSDVWVGGSFSTAGGKSCDSLAQLTSGTWACMNGGSVTSFNAIAFSDGGDMYVGGSFTLYGPGYSPIYNVAKYGSTSFGLNLTPSYLVVLAFLVCSMVALF